MSPYNVIFEPKFASRENLLEDDNARKNALILKTKNFNKTKSTNALEEGIKSHIEECHVVSTYFLLEKSKYVGIYNVQCSNAIV